MQNINITSIQSIIHSKDPEANRDHFANLIEKIDVDTDIIFLPEMFNTAFPAEHDDFAEDENGLSIDWLKKMAVAKDACVVGSLLFQENKNYYNSIIWMFPDRKFNTYHKRHVFFLGSESKSTLRGHKREIIEYKGWKFCPQICYDLRFPVWSRNRYNNGEFEYDVLFYLANWPSKRNHHWKQLLIARAIENQSYSIGINRVGIDSGNIHYTGDSMIISPEGKVLYQAEEEKEAVNTLRLSYKLLDDYRKSFQIAGDWDDFEIKE